MNTAINIKGIETTARVDMFFFVVEIGIVLIIVIGGLKYVLGGGGAGELTMTPIYQTDKVNLTFIATACTIAALNFTGFDGISTLAEEVSEPEKNVGRAILIALVVIGTVFFLQTYIVCLIEPDYNKFNASTALFDACAVAIGDWFRIVLLVVNILAVGIANTLNAQAACSRVLFSMGPVSYTHLDVYKRQLIARAAYFSKTFPFPTPYQLISHRDLSWCSWRRGYTRSHSELGS